jgi:hypothetical protein
MPDQSTDSIKVVVTKNYQSPRVLEMSEHFLTKIGAIYLVLLILSVGSIGSLIWFKTRSSPMIGGPAGTLSLDDAIQSMSAEELIEKNKLLEQKWTDLKTQLETTQAQSDRQSTAPVQNAQNVSSTTDSDQAQDLSESTLPMQDGTESLSKGLPSAFPKNIMDQIRPGQINEKSPVKLSTVRFTLDRTNLKFQFFIQFVGEKGPQQGRIFLIARGPGSLLTYPSSTINAAGVSPTLFSPLEKGEFFSVSRFRETRGSLGPINPQQLPKTLEIFLFSLTGQLILAKTEPVKIQQ